MNQIGKPTGWNIGKYLAFLRFCINTADGLGFDTTGFDWHGLYEFARKQSLTGIVFQGIQRLPAGTFTDKGLLLKWAMVANRNRQINEILNERCGMILNRFAEDGFKGCILKGQGIASLYPDPLLRTPGDIDVWIKPVYPPTETYTGRTERYPYRRSICRYVSRYVPGQKVRYHHVDFPLYKDIPVEIHFTPSYMHSFAANRRMQRWFERYADLQFSNRTVLPGTEDEIFIPTVSFNLVYILSHLYRHVFSEGIGLRQFLDYFYVLTNTDEGMREMARETITTFGMTKFAKAVMWVMQDVFGLKDDFLLFSPDRTEGTFLLNEILAGGNFGQYDTRLGDKSSESFIGRHIRMTRRNLRIAGHYPSEALCEPVFRIVRALFSES